MGIKVSATSTEVREWILKDICGLEPEGSVESREEDRERVESQAQEMLGGEARADSMTEGPVALHHQG